MSNMVVERKRFVKEMAAYFCAYEYAHANIMRVCELEDAESAAKQSARIVEAYEDGFITTHEAVKLLVKTFDI